MSTTGGNPKRQYYPVDYGLPPRPPTASTPLWEHLLNPNSRTATSRADMASVAPPLGPLDKNATSMRILLHDTQSNFEKFGKHVGQLFEEIKECKLEMKTVHSRFERDREGLMGDIVDLVNRSQREIQKAVGNPVQCQQVETFFKDVERRLAGLEHRFDAIQLFNQSHTQALQTQIQAVQLLLDKQASIIAAVLPLLPLLQAVPLHIGTVKSNLKDTLSTFLKDIRGPTPPVKTSPTNVSPVATASTKRKRLDGEEHSIIPPTTRALESLFHKKTRKEEMPWDFSENTRVEPHSASNTSSKSPDRRGPSAALHSVTKAQNSSRRNVTATVGVSPVPDLPAPMSSASHLGTFAVPKLVTPRRPLADLPLVSPSRPPSIQRDASTMSRRPTHETSLGRSNTLASLLSMGNRTEMTPAAAARPPRILRVHASFANPSKPSNVNVESLEISRNGAASSSGALSSSTLSGLPQSLQVSLSVKREIVELPESSNLVAPTIASAGLEILPAKPRSMLNRQQKDRRSPMRVEGRRFIPLVDSEDEEDSAI